ncbi:MAG TPA: hypothetical protein VHH12_08460, partial [Mycobacterium sp.]|nr:hypothetical protein [Mycobacterium sp.]
ADPGDNRGSDRGNSSDRGNDGRGGWKGDERRDDSPNRSAGRFSDDAGGSQQVPQVRIGSGREDTARLSPNDAGASDFGASDSSFGGGSGSDSPRGTSAFEPPQVTFGNGRAPGIQSGDSEPRWQAPAPRLAEPPPPLPPPPPAPVAPAPSWVDRIATPPAVARQFVVAPAAEMTDPLWGIAGLLLIPAAGAVLGYRQARAAQSAERLHRS